MIPLSEYWQRRLPLVVWGVGLLCIVLSALWSLEVQRHEVAERQLGDAGRMAAQLAAMLTLPAWEQDALAAHGIVLAALEDESLYAIRVDGLEGMLAGERRNFQWELVPWDDEFTEGTVSAVSPLLMEGRHVGMVEVHLSARSSHEELTRAARRELWRGGVFALCLSALLACCQCWRPQAGVGPKP
ncbi:MAG: hypothetical protein IJA79_09980 [Desulfovibrio sp.]|nr:hypothetical protein [Desulfovibrio sp.]